MTTATPWSRCSTIRRCTNSMDPTSRPRVGWLAISTLCSRPSSLARMTFCWLPPDSVPAGVAADPVRTSNSVDARRRVPGDLGKVEVDAGGERLPVVRVEDEVLGHRERPDEAVFGAVLRHVGDARPQPGARCRARQVVAVQRDRAGRGGPQPHQRLAQLGLPVALHPGDAQDLPGPHVERQPVHQGPAVVAAHGQVGDPQHGLARLGRRLADPELDVPADHQCREVRLGRRRLALADHRAPAQHGDRVGDRLDFPELVGNEDDRGARRPAAGG